MFHKSRKKIILSIMGSLILLFAVTLAVILFASFREVRKKNLDMLERYAQTYSPGQRQEAPPGSGSDKREPLIDQRPDYQLSTFYAVALAEDGSVLAVDNAGKDVYSEDDLIRIANQIAGGSRRTGMTDTLTFTVLSRDGYTLVAFMDNTVSEGGLKTLVHNVLTFGALAIAVLFFISIYLSGQIIRPLEENDRKQRQFISDAGHELKTPVAVISANAEMLSREIGENEWLSNIQYESERMGGLVKQLLDLSRAENTEAPMEQTDFSRLVTGEALAFESLAFDQGKMIRSDIEEGIVLNGSPSRLTQLASILLDNAVRHSTGDEIELSLKRQGHTAVLIVTNEGEAIPDEKQERLFDRFYRLDESRNSEGQHYGLGLSIARAVAESHGGSIGVSCRNGRVQFTATIPIRKS